ERKIDEEPFLPADFAAAAAFAGQGLQANSVAQAFGQRQSGVEPLDSRRGGGGHDRTSMCGGGRARLLPSRPTSYAGSAGASPSHDGMPDSRPFLLPKRYQSRASSGLQV